MTAVCRSLATLALAAAPMLALAQVMPMPADGHVRYALGGGASYVSGTTSTVRANFGGESVIATADSRWRLGGKALWSRSAGETAAENVSLLLVQESQHRWSRNTWFLQKLSVFPAMRASEGLRSTWETGLAVALPPRFVFNLGVTQRYDGNAATKRADPLFVTAIAVKLP